MLKKKRLTKPEQGDNPTKEEQPKVQQKPEGKGGSKEREKPDTQDEALLSKSGRVIVRNLPFLFKYKHLQGLFEKHGKVLEVNIPMMDVKGAKKGKGFGFVQMEDRPAALKAIKAINGVTFKGRTIAVDMALPTGKYRD